MFEPHFDDDKHLACFLGVSPATLYRWQRGERARHAAARLLEVLEAIEREAPTLLAYLAKPYRKPARPRYVTTRHAALVRPVPVEEPDELPVRREDTKPIVWSRPGAPSREPVYTRAAFDRGEYDHLFAAMDDDQYEAWFAKLV